VLLQVVDFPAWPLEESSWPVACCALRCSCYRRISLWIECNIRIAYEPVAFLGPIAL